MWLDEVAKADRILDNKKILLNVKKMFNKAVMRPAMMHGSEYWPINKKEESNESCRNESANIDVPQGLTRLVRIGNKYIQRNLDVASIAEKMRKNRLKILEHVERRNYNDIVKKIGDKCRGTSGKGWPKEEVNWGFWGGYEGMWNN